ncbi:hypothetical protein [Pseudomonas chlororaphis]|uniref:hypothetical protein n=1 Tax=Pseudomonas chlororaphis TaxID=587753 RepID=UPI0012603974|nr:hypothetical protein [Pseudomonas chlororaphis]
MADIHALHPTALSQDLVDGIHLDTASGDGFASAGLIHKKIRCLATSDFHCLPSAIKSTGLTVEHPARLPDASLIER